MSTITSTRGARLSTAAKVDLDNGRRSLHSNNQVAPDKLETFVGVQALRFIAAFLVVCTHSTLYVSERLDPTMRVWNAGTGGVQIFFVISGFVMMLTSAPFKADSRGWLNFVKRRISRIVPLYWLATAIKATISILSVGVVLHSQFDPAAALMSFLFVPFHGGGGRIEPLLGVGWTLNFEMAFYALFALALAIKADALKLIAPILLAAALSSAFKQPDWPAIAFYLDPIVLNFATGMILAKWAERRPRPRPLIAIIACIIGFGILLARESMFSIPGPLTLCLGATLIVGSVVNLEPLLRGQIPQWLAVLGASSYSLYLCHPLIAPVVPSALKLVNVVQPAVAVPMCIFVAVTTSIFVCRFVEQPLSRATNGLLQVDRVGGAILRRP